MKLLAVSLGLWLAAIAIHVVWWRIKPPKSHTLTLLMLFGVASVPALIWAFPVYGNTGSDQAWLDRLHFLIFYGPMALSYVSFYTLIEHSSPSLGLVTAAQRPEGLSREEMMATYGAEALISGRLEAAVGNGWLKPLGEDRWQLTDTGRKVGRFFDFFTTLFKLKDVG
jgi:hypothetical protein